MTLRFGNILCEMLASGTALNAGNSVVMNLCYLCPQPTA